MPDKILNDSFYMEHYDGELSGKGGFDSATPLPPNTRTFDDPDFPEPEPLDGLANVFWDADAEEFFVFNPDDPQEDPSQISPRFGEMRYDFDVDEYTAFDGNSFVYPHPRDGDVRYNWDDGTLEAYDATLPGWVAINLFGTFIVFLTPPRQVEPGEESEELIIQRQDGQGNPLSVGDLDVFLYSSDPDMTFSPSNVVTILDGDDSYAFTYVTPNAGDPVITASPEELV